jgi:hypothetical protein
MTTTTTTLDLGNNETLAAGVIAENDGTFTAFTFSASKNFKTFAGAHRWLARRGFAA